MDNRAGYPLYAAINVTTRCNLDCRYCYLRPRSGLDMAATDFKMVVDDLQASSIFFVHLSGGEPFLHPQFNELVEYACDRIRDVSILTNGTVLREEHLLFLERAAERTPIKIQVSIDSVHDEINRRTRNVSPALVRRNIARLSTTGVLLAAGMVVTKHNIHTLVESIIELREHIKYFHIMCIQDTEYDPGLEQALKPEGTELSTLWMELDRVQDRYDLDISKPSDFVKSNYKGCAYGAPCAAAFTYAVIDPNLDVRPCDKLNGVVLGNMRRAGLK